MPSFPIVGIGASAGGLEAYVELLKSLPSDTNMAFVLVPHLSAAHESRLAEILQRSCSMRVIEVEDEPRVEPNTVYVIPPNRGMVMNEGHLNLLPRVQERGQHRPVDSFLRSLAEDRTHQAVGVILSGMGNDGTLGLEAIKAEGGITFAQNETAQQSGMPRSAISAGCVDFVLPPEEIARELARIGRHPYVAPPPAGVPEVAGLEPLPNDDVGRILRLLHEATGVDFANYKSTTLYRRITRRMLLHKLEGLKEYLRFLQANPTEVQSLYRDILISVTCFFRDPEAIEALKTQVFPNLIKNRTRLDPLRIWVLGCSTGEEAYSIAIAISEVVASLGIQAPAQVFATDLNEHGIEKARTGIYSKNIANDISAERLRRFFVETETGYQIAKSIRDMCVFARQNVLSDPPFSRMDLITCRNLLIYMEPVLQRKVVPLFHYALKPRGYLWLGSSETIGSFSDLFGVVDAKHKIYLKKAAATPGQLVVPLTAPAWEPLNPLSSPRRRTTEAGVTSDVQKEADRLSITKYSPPGVLVNGDFDIVQFRGDTSHYLAAAPGKPSLNVLKMAREGLLVGLRAALQKAMKEGVPVRQEHVQVKSNGGMKDISLEVIPVRPPSSQETSYLILFERAGSLPQGELVPPSPPLPQPGMPGMPGMEENAERQIARLTQELAATRDYLQSLIEQQEAANEELQSANEEIQSSNEELQSINEELQTSKEEIQSSNEELTTVNEELYHRNEQLTLANDDLTNFIASTQLALVMLGRDLTIRRFTLPAEKLLNLLPTDVGRPLGDLNLPLTTSDLHQAIVEVIDTVRVIEREVQDKQGRWYSLRLRPYKTSDNRIDGAVLVLVDIDAQKRTELQLRASEEKYRMLIEGAKEMAIIILDSAGLVSLWNVGAERLFGYTEEEIVRQPLRRFFTPEDVARGRPERELEQARENLSADDDNWLVRKDGSRFWASGTTTAIWDDKGKLVGFSKIVRDVSERKRGEDALKESEERFRLLADHSPMLIWLTGPEGCEYANRACLEYLGLAGDGTALDWLSYIHPDDREGYSEKYSKAYAEHQKFETQFRFRRHDGEYRWMKSVGVPRRTSRGEVVGYVGSTVDIDDVKGAEEALRAADHRKNEFLAVVAHELRNPLAPIRNSLEILRVTRGDQDAELSREVIDRQVRMLSRMIDDLLDISRIARGKIALKPELAELQAVIRLAVEGIQFHVAAKEQRLVLDLPVEPLYVEGDPLRLEQVVANLLGNAVKYTDGGGTIHLSLERQGREGVLTVRDSGIGIAPELLPRIFEMFTQGDTSQGRDGGGLGIGLSLVHQLVQLHMGAVRAVSDGVGKGSTFEVRLPLLTEAQVRKARWAEGMRGPKEGPVAARRILVVDDNVDAAESLARLLRLFQHEVEVAFSGPNALEIAETFKPEVVLLDIGMPKMDGYEVARRLREQEGNESMALVALSGYAKDEDSDRAREAGFDVHLVKPVDPSRLQWLLSGR